MLVFSLTLVAVSVALTFNHSYHWSLLGNVGWWSLGLGVALAIIVFLVPVWLISHRLLALPSFYQLMSQLHLMVKELTWPQILVISILAGIGEELLFRGLLQSWLAQVIGVYSAIVLSSIIFGLLHAMTRYYFTFTFLLSLCFAWLFHATQSMLLLITLHAVYDIIALAVIAKYPHYLGITSENGNQLRL